MFKKKKEIKPSNTVISRSVIKPTYCKFCRSTYQAVHTELDFWDPARQKYDGNPEEAWSACPLCRRFNKVEFEEEREE